MKNFFKRSAVFLGSAAMTLLALTGYYSGALPDSIYTSGDVSLDTFFSITATQTDITPEEDAASYTLSLFGTVPIKDIDASLQQPPMLVPCGQPFGIRLITDGVLVVDLQSVTAFDGQMTCPASRCGIHIGDIVTSVDGQSVSSNADIAKIVEGSEGEPISVTLKRDDEIKTLTLTPELTGGKYRAGMWVRDSSAGIGTLTFYDEATGGFGGLGHPICDADTAKPLPLSDGNTGEVEITGTVKSRDGAPGELVGKFVSSRAVGVLKANSSSGVFGRYFANPSGYDAIPLGYKQEVRTGKAYIYTTLEGNEPQMYEISINSCDLSENAQHGMVVEMTDPALLEKAGGIVQGMSGSPIIQNGKLIGAVTHVFTDDPTKGYAVFAEKMYLEMLKSLE